MDNIWGNWGHFYPNIWSRWLVIDHDRQTNTTRHNNNKIIRKGFQNIFVIKCSSRSLAGKCQYVDMPLATCRLRTDKRKLIENFAHKSHYDTHLFLHMFLAQPPLLNPAFKEDQCDQNWRNFTTLARKINSLVIFVGLFSIGQKFNLIWKNYVLLEQISIIVNGQIF